MSTFEYMTPEERVSSLTPLLNLAARALPSLSAADRADVYEGIAVLSALIEKPNIATAACAAAAALRDAEARQLTFAALLAD